MSQRVLLQLDRDDQPSSFDSVVAVDAGVEHLLRYGRVRPEGLASLVHGAMFTRGGDDLQNTAIFVGGSDVGEAEQLFRLVQDTFFGPVRVSVMLDANGCNTTASAAVVAAGRHTELASAKAVVLGATGPVGRRVAQLLAREGAQVSLTSRSLERARETCQQVSEKVDSAKLTPVAVQQPDQLATALQDAHVVIACGAAGVELVSESMIQDVGSLAVAIDLNAVPPAGIGGIEVTSKAASFGSAVAYGAIGVGGLKMQTHKTALQNLFEANDRVLDAEEIYAIAKSIG